MERAVDYKPSKYQEFIAEILELIYRRLYVLSSRILENCG